jgi:hypothetical protein
MHAASRRYCRAEQQESDLVGKRIDELSQRLQQFLYAGKDPVQEARDQETTNVIIRVAEGSVICVSPSTLSSLHRWLDAQSQQVPHVNAMWDALQLDLKGRNFFAPKHELETLQLSLKVPPLRVEFYSLLGESLCGALLMHGLSLALHLDEQMHISGEEPTANSSQPSVEASPQPVHRTRTRNLTALVRSNKEQHVVKGGASESFMGGGGGGGGTTEALAPPVLRKDKTRARSQPASAKQGPVATDGKDSRSLSVDVPESVNMSQRPATTRPEGRVNIVGKSFLRKVSANVTLKLLSLVIYDSAEPGPSPTPVLVLKLAQLEVRLAQ